MARKQGKAGKPQGRESRKAGSLGERKPQGGGTEPQGKGTPKGSAALFLAAARKWGDGANFLAGGGTDEGNVVIFA